MVRAVLMISVFVLSTVSGYAETDVAKKVWFSTLSAHVEKFKRYPPSVRGIAVVVVRFAFDRTNGKLIDSKVEKSSGVDAFDQEALATIRRAAPFPQPPPGVEIDTEQGFRLELRYRLGIPDAPRTGPTPEEQDRALGLHPPS